MIVDNQYKNIVFDFYEYFEQTKSNHIRAFYESV